ncbi:endonuclease [Rhodothermaceae bacterium RA]|nr:endonuclease [Rhodothermaceae bacterium RA]
MSFRRPARLLLVLLIALSLPGAGCHQPPPPPSTAATDAAGPAPVFTPEPPPVFATDGLRIATLNTAFLFDGYGDEGQASFPHQGNPDLARRHRDRIAALLRMIDADLVMLQEVEHERVLEHLLAESLSDLGYHIYFVEGNDTFTGQDVALLSRLPVDQIGRTDRRARVEGSRQTYGVSKNLYARLYLGDLPVTLIGVHLLARPLDPERRARREAQAEVIRTLVVQEQQAGRAVIVLGDFNDYDDAVPDRSGNRPITDVLARIKAAGPGPEDDLHNVLADVPPAERFTAHYDRDDDGTVDEGELTAIDHILLLPTLYRHVREVHYVQAHDPTTSTDHFPVVVVLDVR